MREVLSQVPEKRWLVSIALVRFRASIRHPLDIGRNIDSVLPLEFTPHTPELRFVAVSGFDVVHDIDMDVAEYNTSFLGTHFPDNITENDP